MIASSLNRRRAAEQPEPAGSRRSEGDERAPADSGRDHLPAPHPPRKPRGLLKWAFNLPRALYRLRLGWLLGHHFLLLTHRGRRTGRVHRSVLEVARYDPATRESIVFSAYGDRSDWYRNIQATPALEVETGREHYIPMQRTLDADERYAVLAAYRHRYGPLLGFVLRFMGYPYTGRDDELRAIARQVHAVGFRAGEDPSGTSAHTSDAQESPRRVARRDGDG